MLYIYQVDYHKQFFHLPSVPELVEREEWQRSKNKKFILQSFYFCSPIVYLKKL